MMPIAFGAAVIVVLLQAGCLSPSVSQPVSRTEVLSPDAGDDLGGSFLESADIRALAAGIAAGLLEQPAFQGTEPVVVAVAPVRNTTRHVVDSDLLMKRLRLELNRTAGGRIQFLQQQTGQETRRAMLNEQDRARWESKLDEVAVAINEALAGVSTDGAPVPVIVGQAEHVNAGADNAESIRLLLKVALNRRAGDHVKLVEAPASGSMVGIRADYVVGLRLIGVALQDGESGSALELEVSLVPVATGASMLTRKVTVRHAAGLELGRAAYLLTGELSGLSKASQGDRSDYVLAAFQLVDPNNNTIIWEDAYETKKRTNVSVLYK